MARPIKGGSLVAMQRVMSLGFLREKLSEQLNSLAQSGIHVSPMHDSQRRGPKLLSVTFTFIIVSDLLALKKQCPAASSHSDFLKVHLLEVLFIIV